MGGGRVITLESWPPSAEFWADEFQHATGGATQPFLFKSVLPRTLTVDDVVHGFDRIRQAAADGATADARIRVYVGEEQRDDLIATVLSTDRNGDDFLPWMQKTLGADRFSVVVNNLESTSDHLAAEFGTLIQSSFGGWGVPVGGCEQVAFMGNYAGTAFGVHQGFEDAFLTHLGPGVKDFYCWPQEHYVQLAGTTKPTFGDYRWMLPSAQRFQLEAGDVLFLPRRVFHVGLQNEFSVSVALPLYTYPLARLLARSVLPEVLDTVMQDLIESPSALQREELGWTPLANELHAVVNDLLPLVRRRLDESLVSIVARRWNTLMSNGGWELLPNDLGRDDATPDPVAVREIIQPGTCVTTRPPFRLLHDQPDEATGKVAVYLRGQQVDLRTSPAVVAIIGGLVDGQSVVAPTCAETLDALRTLYRTGGLQVVPAGRGSTEPVLTS